jgi:hypothetical protein
MLGHARAAMTLDLYGCLFDDDLTGVADARGKVSEILTSLRYNERGGAESELLKVANSE